MKIDVLKLVQRFLGKTENVEYEIDESTTNTTLPYNAETIVKRASDIISPVPYKYKEMQRIKPKLNTNQWDINYRTELFYLQAKYMEDFEDDYEYEGEFIRYSPVYADMTLSEQRGYFTWRTKVRKGTVEKTSLSFVFVYIYELLNNVGVICPQDGLDKLLFIWNSYKEHDKKINTYLKKWVKGYIIYYALDIENLKYVQKKRPDNSSILNDIDYCIQQNDFSNFSEIINYLSAYKIIKSKFYRAFKDDYNETLKQVYFDLQEFYDKKRKTTIFEKMFGHTTCGNWMPFEKAMFYNNNKTNRKYFINNFESYVCVDGEWKIYHPYNQNYKASFFIGEILKTVEFYLREIYGYDEQITFNSSSKTLTNLIEKSVKKYCTNNNKYGISSKLKEKHTSKKLNKKESSINMEPVIVEIDITKFDAIREKSLITQEKLIVETIAEENSNKKIELVEEDSFVVNDSQNGMQLFMINLTDYEKKIVSLLLQESAEKISLISKEVNIMEQVLLEGINEKALECIEDNIIDTNDDTPYIYEDYTEELQGVIKTWQQSQKESQQP